MKQNYVMLLLRCSLILINFDSCRFVLADRRNQRHKSIATSTIQNQHDLLPRGLSKGKAKLSKHAKDMKKTMPKTKKGVKKSELKSKKKGQHGFKNSKKQGKQSNEGLMFIKEKQVDGSNSGQVIEIYPTFPQDTSSSVFSVSPASIGEVTSSPAQMSTFAQKFEVVKQKLLQIQPTTELPTSQTQTSSTPSDKEPDVLLSEPTPSPTQISFHTSERDIGTSTTSASELNASVQCFNTSATNSTPVVVSFLYQVLSDLKLQITDLLPLKNQMVFDLAKPLLNCTPEQQQRTRNLVTNIFGSDGNIVGINGDPIDKIREICQSSNYKFMNCTLVNGYMTIFVTGAMNNLLYNDSTTANPVIKMIDNLMNSGRYDNDSGTAGIQQVRLVNEPSAVQQQISLNNTNDQPVEDTNSSPELSTKSISLIFGGSVLALDAFLILAWVIYKKTRGNNSGTKRLSDEVSSIDDSSGSAEGKDKNEANSGIQVIEINDADDTESPFNDIPFDEGKKGEAYENESPFDEPVQHSSRFWNTRSSKLIHTISEDQENCTTDSELTYQFENLGRKVSEQDI